MPAWDRASTPRTGTRGQIALRKVIEKIGFDVEEEYPVAGYFIDCYAMDPHLGFEFDGPLHRGMRARDRDEARDENILAVSAIHILRITTEDLRDKGKLIERVRRFILDHEHDADERRRKWQMRRP